MRPEDPIGRTIVGFRKLTDTEMEQRMWYPSAGDMPMVIELDDGSCLLPMRDPEGNGPGVVTWTSPQGEEYLVGPPS